MNFPLNVPPEEVAKILTLLYKICSEVWSLLSTSPVESHTSGHSSGFNNYLIHSIQGERNQRGFVTPFMLPQGESGGQIATVHGSWSAAVCHRRESTMREGCVRKQMQCKGDQLSPRTSTEASTSWISQEAEKHARYEAGRRGWVAIIVCYSQIGS